MNADITAKILEWSAVITSVIYVVLAARQNILCWIFALLSSGLYVYICFSTQLYIESMLQLFYFVMGVYGWVNWNRKNESHHTQEVSSWGIGLNFVNILASGVLTIALGYVFDHYTNQASPYTDAFVTSFSITATYMITKKIHEGWIYLIVIDFCSIFLYAGRGLDISAWLYVMYTIIAVFGWIEWLRSYMQSKST